MKVGEILSRYILVTSGAKSNHTEIWKAFEFNDALMNVLEETTLDASLPEGEQSKFLENLIQQTNPQSQPYTLSIFNMVQMEEVQHFEKQYELLKSWENPHLIKVFYSEYKEAKQYYFLVTEYLQGLTLNRMVAQKGPDGIWARKACKKILEVVQEIHGKEIIHGGFRPDSFVFSDDGDFKVRGFGILDLLGGPMGSRSPRGPGALRFVPRELWEKDNPPNIASDIYSLGMILYYLFSGTLPIKGDKPSEIYSEISNFGEKFSSLAKKNHHLPLPLVQIVDGMIEKPAQQRKTWDEISQILSAMEESAWESGLESLQKQIIPTEEKSNLPEEFMESHSPSESTQIQDLKKKILFLQSKLFTFIQKNQTMEKEFAGRIESLQKMKDLMEDLVKKYENIVSSAQQAFQNMDKFKSVLEKNILSEGIPPLPSIEVPSLWGKDEFYCAYQSGLTRICGYSWKADPFLEVLTLEWQGTIEKNHTSDLRVHLAEIATRSQAIVFMDFTTLEPWDETAMNLVAGFMSALSGKKVHSMLYGAPPALAEILSQRKIEALFISSLEGVEKSLLEFKKKVGMVLFPTHRDHFKKLSSFVEKLIEQGYTNFLANLAGKALRGDDMEGLLAFYKLCQRSKVQGNLCGVTAEMKTVFKIMNLDELQNSYANEKEAFESMIGKGYHKVEISDFV